jgi:tripartite-type tricarboxylate transporter receptor subunit TctC
MFAPAGTPTPILTRLNREVSEILVASAARSAFSKQGLTFEPGTLAEVAAFVRDKNQAYLDIMREIPELQKR